MVLLLLSSVADAEDALIAGMGSGNAPCSSCWVPTIRL